MLTKKTMGVTNYNKLLTTIAIGKSTVLKALTTKIILIIDYNYYTVRRY